MSDKVLVMVDCISTHRMRYCVEAPADHPEYALDTVTMYGAKEFSQLWLGENIVSHRIVDKDEALRVLDADEPAYSDWSEEEKIETFFTTDVEKHTEQYYDTERNR